MRPYWLLLIPALLLAIFTDQIDRWAYESVIVRKCLMTTCVVTGVFVFGLFIDVAFL